MPQGATSVAELADSAKVFPGIFQDLPGQMMGRMAELGLTEREEEGVE